jgi:type II secretory pathway predicted ATPase ExeA
MHDDQLYLNHYGLISNPFRGIPERRFIWLGDKQLEILAHLKIGIEQAKGVLLLLGEEGSGKSVLLDCLIRIIEGELLAATLTESGISVGQLLAWLADQYGIGKEIGSKADFLINFRKFLLEAHSSGKKVLLVIEDAQKQNDDVIEEIRLFSNIEAAGQKLLSLLLIGNKELEARLSEHRHRALLQRVAVRCQVDSLSEKEAARYIRHRMMVAGCFLEIFTAEAVRSIHRFSGGAPRLIDLACDHALMRGYFEGVRAIDGKIMSAYTKAINNTFTSGESDFQPAALKSLEDAQTPSPRRRSSRLAQVILALAFFFLISYGVSYVKFEEKPVVVIKPIASAPINVYFESGSAKLSADQFPLLDIVAEYLVKNQQQVVFIRGYSDSKGSKPQNIRISTERAEAAKEYLVRKGVTPDKIQAFGMGSLLPPASVLAPDEEKLQRRVEIEIDTGPRTSR